MASQTLLYAILPRAQADPHLFLRSHKTDTVIEAIEEGQPLQQHEKDD